MSSSVSSRPLSLIPFLAADGVLLLTAALIAWRTPDALTGGALLGVIFCMGLGAVLTVVPFIVNDAHEREAELARRQRELTEVVNTTTATATRWGTQWAGAALGLEDAARLASRSLAAAESLPAVFQAKADVLTARLAEVEREAQVRADAAVKLEGDLQRTLAEFGRVESELRERHTALAAVPAQIEAQMAQVARGVTETEVRIGATATALTERLAGLETVVGELAGQLQRAASEAAEKAAMPVAEVAPVVVPANEEILARLDRLEAAITALGERWVQPAAVEVVPETVVEPVRQVVAVEVIEPVVEVAVVPEAAPVVPVAEKPVVRLETIMDPFLIPDDGYASLAEAMDLRNE